MIKVSLTIIAILLLLLLIGLCIYGIIRCLVEEDEDRGIFSIIMCITTIIVAIMVMCTLVGTLIA